MNNNVANDYYMYNYYNVNRVYVSGVAVLFLFSIINNNKIFVRIFLLLLLLL